MPGQYRAVASVVAAPAEDGDLAVEKKDHQAALKAYAAAEALGTIGPIAVVAIPALNEALADANAFVRRAAAQSLEALIPKPVSDGERRPLARKPARARG